MSKSAEYFYPDEYEDDRECSIKEQQQQQRYESALIHHPDCTDPDHPGCEACSD